MIRCDVLIKCIHTISNGQSLFRIGIEKWAKREREREQAKKMHIPITIRCKGCGYLNVFSILFFFVKKNRLLHFFLFSCTVFQNIRTFL